MKRFRLNLMGLILTTSLSLTACGGGGSSDGGSDGGPGTVADTPLEVTSLANLAGGSFSAGIAINPDGVAVGYADDGTTLKAVKWNLADPSVVEKLQPLDAEETRYCAAYGINADGTTVGESENGTNIVAVYWPANSTTAVALNTVGLPAGNSAAYAMNANGEIVGEAGDSTVAVYWSGPTANPVILGTLINDPETFSAAYFINDAGFAVGESLNSSGETQAVLWTPGAGGTFVANQSPTPLSEIAGQTSSVAFGVDLSGIIVGEAEAGGQVFGVVWNPDGTVKDTLQATSSAQFINNNDRIVGYVDANSGSDIATTWNAANTGDSRSLSTGTFSQAYGANDDQKIVGIADDQAFMASPALQ